MLEESSCTPRLSFNQRDQYESGSRHIVFIFRADTERPSRTIEAIPLPWLRLPHLYFLSRHNAPLVRNTFNKDAESIVSEGDEGRVAWVSRISLSPVEIRPSREATRLEESNNTTKRTGRNATGTNLSNLNLYASREYI